MGSMAIVRHFFQDQFDSGRGYITKIERHLGGISPKLDVGGPIHCEAIEKLRPTHPILLFGPKRPFKGS